ncbi:hypothetical protein JZ751_006142 [Albula glossodonta]|uniref:Uncharacterized protein n=1 Tax=Albula glossodonta TaxID=121402 RepID=A0A8T2NBE0_9TELE|nr:hypothetical protein JZ751_006142 [Albula glossodonta]
MICDWFECAEKSFQREVFSKQSRRGSSLTSLLMTSRIPDNSPVSPAFRLPASEWAPLRRGESDGSDGCDAELCASLRYRGGRWALATLRQQPGPARQRSARASPSHCRMDVNKQGERDTVLTARLGSPLHCRSPWWPDRAAAAWTGMRL